MPTIHVPPPRYLDSMTEMKLRREWGTTPLGLWVWPFFQECPTSLRWVQRQISIEPWPLGEWPSYVPQSSVLELTTQNIHALNNFPHFRPKHVQAKKIICEVRLGGLLICHLKACRSAILMRLVNSSTCRCSLSELLERNWQKGFD